MRKNFFGVIFSVSAVLLIAILEISFLSLSNKNKYKPSNNTIYGVVLTDKQTGLSICSSGSNNFLLLKIPSDITKWYFFLLRQVMVITLLKQINLEPPRVYSGWFFN